ncbi:hypothetical protein RCL_jg22940.t1 [Rhizophagus clarus]|uniref:Uncharacterized protein n=1 Tax=Rhizophagus clarus TaxID=94130 RepID=A0A8H3L6D1_9GLOM|nr:hypothetical protein RCL_jg22940.t1 [Rhizophagus clarus]
MLKYTSLVSKSKESAATLSYFARNHATVTLPYLKDDNKSSDDKQKLIDASQKAIKGKQEEAKNLVQEFASYKADILKFKVDFKNWAEGKLKEANDEIKEVKAHIKSLRDQINNHFKLVGGLAIGFGFGTFIGPAAISCGIAMGVYLAKIDGLQKKLIGAQAQLASLEAKRGHINEACWDDINAELTKLSNDLSFYGKIYNIVPEQYNFTVNIWTAFADALDMYISDVLGNKE